MNRCVVIGSGIAVPAGFVEITVLSRKPFHDVRVRNYEADLSECRIPLSDVLDPVGISHVVADIKSIDTDARTVITSTGTRHRYDRLVLASGSHVVVPDLPGIREFAFDVDTYDGAAALKQHLHALAHDSSMQEVATAVVVGAGLTGIETACELPGRLRSILGEPAPRVVLIDQNPWIGSDMGIAARPVIDKALSDNGVEARTGVRVAKVAKDSVSLSSGEQIQTATLIWCAGMRASSLTAELPVARDRLGRVTADNFLRVTGVAGVFAAGDVAAAQVDSDHLSVMSCQHGRPMGRYAGYNVVSDLFDRPMLPLRIPWYVTVLDLGPAGALYTEGWDRQVVVCGADAKAIKRTINAERIYPPLTGHREALLAAAAPDLQARPSLGH
jgi:NADH dehydrogenase